MSSVDPCVRAYFCEGYGLQLVPQDCGSALFLLRCFSTTALTTTATAAEVP
jgi:hypothetical protein